MKKRKLLVGLCMAAALALCGAFAACGGTKEPDPDEEGGGSSSIEVWDLKLDGEKTRTLEIDEEITEPVTDTLTWTVTKDGEPVTTEAVAVTLAGESVTYDEASHTVTAVKAGRATVTLTLTGHTDVLPVSVTYEVVDYFFSREVQRGTLNFSGESGGQVNIMGGQATLVAERKATAWVFRTTLSAIDYSTQEAFGIGSFLDNGDHALWFGMQNRDGQPDGKFDILQKDYYAGWAGTDFFPEGYRNRSFDLAQGVACEIIRSGNDYYYTIGTYYGSYTAQDDTAETYPGVFSQERVVTVSGFSVSYDADDVSAAVAAYETKGVASVVINETQKNRLIKGSSEHYTATCYPAGKGGTVAWSLDKSGMTAGQEETTVDEQGNLQLGADAAGVLTLICTAGDAHDTLTITILSEIEDKENDRLYVKGGALLEENGDVVFPEYMMGTDGIGNEDAYTETPGYGAILKQKVRGNFSIEFTVSEYKENVSSPKLMISLGGTHNQFYIVYNDNTTFRIETRTDHVYDNAIHDNDWVNSDPFASFDAGIPHTFKIEVRNGIYNMTVDGGSPLVFKTNTGAHESTLVRKFEDCNAERPIRISTHGVSARVSNITVTQNETTLPAFFSFGNAETEGVENGFTMQFYKSPTNAGQGYDGWAQARTRVIRTAANPEGDFTLTMNMKFSAAMTDSKAIILLGNTQELQFCNKIAAGQGIVLQLVDGFNFGQTYAVPYEMGTDGMYTVALRIERSGNTNRIIANGAEICRPEYAAGAHLAFSVFNEKADEADATVEFSGITFGAYAASDVYTIENLTKDVTLSVNGQHEVTFTVNCNNNPVQAESYTAEVTTEDGTLISYDEGSKKVTALAAGEATLTITVKVEGEVVCTATVTFHITARETADSNEDWQVKGGVVLYTDDNSIEFPVSNQSTNGVGDEGSYQDNAYSANYKKTVVGNFSVKFTVTNYKTIAEYPKLMISLGGTNEQFYVVYKTDGSGRIETFTRSKDSSGNYYGGQWVNSANFANFDATKPHTFEIKVVDGGLYEVYLDNTKVEGFNMDGNPRTIYRGVEDYAIAQPIRISTNGVSCTVSDITVTQSGTSMPEYFGYSNVQTEGIENGLSMQFIADTADGGWAQARNNRAIRTAANPEGNCNLTMNITFSKAMTDSKAIILLGNTQELQFCNKIAAGQGIVLQLVEGGSFGQTYTVPYEAGEDGTYTVALRIERSGNTNRIIANGAELCRPEYAIGAHLQFSVFNTNADEADTTVKFTDITFGQYEELDIYTIENLSGAVTLTVGAEQELSYEVHRNGNKITEGYEVEVTTEEKGFVSYAGGKIKADAKGEENVTITVKVGEKVVCTAVVKVTVIDRPTADSNENWTVKGGVVLYTDDNSIEFPEAYQGTNGVGNETDYATADYSADYNKTVIGNFSIKFTVTNYKTTAQYPKLMISLGGSNEQFYVVYNREGHVNRIETFTKSFSGNGNGSGGQWVSSGEFAEFDTNAPHTFEIKVVSGGLYEVYLDNTKIEGFNMDGDSRTMFRRYEDYSTEQPIRISTNGVSCTVSNIVVTNGTAEDVKTSGTENENWFTHSAKYISSVTDDGFTMAMQNFSWGANDNYGNRIFRLTSALEDTYTIEFNLTFSASMTDGKFVVRMDDIAVMINNKPGEISCNINGVDHDWAAATVAGASLTMKVKIQRTADKIAVYFNDAAAATREFDTGNKPRTLSFYAFNENADEASVTATVSNLTVS